MNNFGRLRKVAEENNAIKKPRAAMVKYLLRETRYTVEELSEFDDATIEQFYKEEVETNKEV